jgi:tetratricopeptide (TPR) repeat protein
MAGKTGKLHLDHSFLIILLFATLVVYFRVLFFGHISWDDPEMVFRNQAVREFDLGALFRGSFVGNYLPVTMLMHAFTFFVFGENETGHHLVNLLFHLTNGFLLYRLTDILFKQRSFAVITTCIFLLHPLQVETVAWISELKNIIFVFFFLWALIVYTRYISSGKKSFYWYTLALFILSCLSKPSAVVFPIVLVCVDLILQPEKTVHHLKWKLPFLFVALAFGILNLQTQSEARFINYAHAFPVFERIGMAGFGLLNYFRLFVLPARLSVIYPFPDPDTAKLATGYAVILLLSAGLFILIRKKKYTLLAMIMFVCVNLALVLQIIPFGEVLYADRYMYLAIAGAGWFLAWVMTRLAFNYRIVTTAILIFFSALTFARSGKWKNAITLYEDILSHYPDNFVALNSAGVEDMRLGNDRQALSYFQMAVRSAPRNYKGHYNMGLLFLKTQVPDKAITKFNDAIGLYEYAKAYTGRATAYYMKGDLSKSVNDAEKAILLDPGNPKPRFVLGNCYNDMNDLEKALDSFNGAIRLDPHEGEYYFKRGIVKGKKQDFKGCLEDLQLSIHLKPDLYEAFYWVGVAKMNLKQDPCADLKVAARHNYEPAIKAVNSMCR